MAVNVNLVAQLGVLAAQLIEEEEADYEAVMLLAARIGAAEIMELEEGVGLDEFVGDAWVPVRVFIDDYHQMGDPCFKIHFRVSRGVFEVLCGTVRNHLVEKGRLRRERTPFQDIMLMCLWLLATPDSFRSVALRFGVVPATLHYFYSYVIEALRELAPLFISWPDEQMRITIKGTFQRATGFPGVVGCIDGTHVYVTAPVQDAAQYRNRHHTYSLNVQAVVDSTLLVRDLHVGEVGSMHDNRVFRRSPLQAKLLRREILSPDEHLVGDGAYTLTDFMMIPFENNGRLTPQQLNFNRTLSQSRVRVENAFARAKGKWRRLKFLHARNQSIVVDHITASFVLHNFGILNGEPLLEEDELARPMHDWEVADNDAVHVNAVDEDDEDDEYDEELEASKVRGSEKRFFIMDHVLHNI